MQGSPVHRCIEASQKPAYILSWQISQNPRKSVTGIESITAATKQTVNLGLTCYRFTYLIYKGLPAHQTSTLGAAPTMHQTSTLGVGPLVMNLMVIAKGEEAMIRKNI